jgi:DNA-binding response OmpR family regulator
MKVLFVEDDKDIRESIKESLELEDFVVDTLSDGREALNRVVTNHADYDMVILDMMLPTMDGKEICREIRNQGISIPVIMLTGKSDLREKVETLNAGADDYVTKPFYIDELVARLHAIMRRPTQATQDHSLVVDNLELNVTERKVYKDGVEFPLTGKEFHILELLMRNPNQVIGRERLLAHAWDFNYTSFTNVVDVHINSIRKKLHLHKEHELVTVHGVGYKLVSNPQSS